MAYKGSALQGNQLMYPGDYLMSPNGRFAALFLANGSFTVYWTRLVAPQSSSLPTFDPGEGGSLWNTHASDAGTDYFLCMQTDGNFVVYRGKNFQDNQGVLWASNTGLDRKQGTYSLMLGNDGALTVQWSEQIPFFSGLLWSSGTEVKGVGEQRLLSGVDFDIHYQRRMSLSSDSPLDKSPGVSLRETPGEVPDEQIWMELRWYQQGALVGSVFQNKKTGTVLSSNGYQQPASTSDYINSNSIWTRGGAENNSDVAPPALTALRPLGDIHQNLNVKGDGPYDGSAVVLWGWSLAQGGSVRSNLIWEVVPASDPS